ncbi:MAG: acyl-CoA dehydrogenase family protein [Candidatus Dormibacteraeota bacterium]|nr:acyl-CoA dehydrogenase family protein [Candidatus Dormibacteraeota bacterium]
MSLDQNVGARVQPGPEHETFRAVVREFARSTVRTHAADVDREHRFPREAIVEARALGLMGMLIPPEFEGAGLDHLAFTIAIEEIARECASTAVIVDVHNSVAAEPILLFGTEEQKRRWLPQLARAERLGAFALTEPDSGSDASALQTTARRVPGGWILNGTKVFITIVGEAGMYLVFARSGPEPRAAGVSAFIVPAETEGVRTGQIFRKMGLHGSPTGELVLEDVRLDESALLGDEGQGFGIAMRALDAGRIGISGQALGVAAGALDEALEHTRERGHSGRPAAVGQGMSFALADLATRVEAARQLAYHAAALCAAGQPFTLEASMAKLYCTDSAMDVASETLQLAGGEGYMADLPFERHFRDAKALQIYEGTNQVQRIVIARHLLSGAGAR